MDRFILRMVFLAAITFTVPAEATVFLHDGLVSVWSFNESTGATTACDTGGFNSNDAVFSSGMATTGSGFSSGGVSGNYLQFFGSLGSDSIALINPDPSFDLGDQMTFSTWVHIDQDPVMQEELYLGIFDSQADDYAMYVQRNDGTIRMKLVTESGNYRIMDDCYPILNNWTHVAVTYDGHYSAMTRMYINGIEVASHFGLWGNLQSGQTPAFGGQVDPNTGTISGNFYGGIDETGLWNRTLSSEEIAYLYNYGMGREIMADNPTFPIEHPDPPGGPLGTPLLHYQFENDLTNSGSLGAAYDGVYQEGDNGTLTYETGILSNGCIKLDNEDGQNDGSRIAVPFDLSSLDQGTIGFWVKENVSYNYNTIFSSSADPNDWEMWIYEDDALENKYRMRLDYASLSVNPGVSEAGQGLDEWNHFAISWVRNVEDPDTAYVWMFLNGQIVSRTTSAWNSSGPEFYLGGGSGNYFGSWIMDDFRLYDAAWDGSWDPWPPKIPGDANRDGVVDGSDVTILANNWQYGVGEPFPDATWEMGDFNDDGRVDGSDVTILANNWQFGVILPSAAVPEPSVATLLFLLAVPFLLSYESPIINSFLRTGFHVSE